MIAVVAGVVFAAGFTTGWVVQTALTPKPTSITLDAVMINLSYASGSYQTYGPTGLRDVCYGCPMTYSAGTEPVLTLWAPYDLSNVTQQFNISVSAPIPFEGFVGAYGVPPGPFYNHWKDQNLTLPAGFSVGVGLILSIGDPAPAASPFYITANITADIV
jgi:hypothetical protein